MSDREQLRLVRWRLILGSDCQACSGAALSAEQQQCDAALDYLYNREYGDSRNTRERSASLGASVLTVPDWINSVHELFPRRTIERLERDALERYQINEIVTNPQVLERAQPNRALLEAVLRTKHLMNTEVLAVARALVRKVVQEIVEKLAFPVRQPFLGARERRRSLHRLSKNFDWRATIRRNLKNYDRQSRRLLIETPYFVSRVRRHVDRWQLIIVVDQSGSMMSSVIYSAVMASIFHQLPVVRTHLIAFDTSVVDLTGECGDPVETLMKVQLGGGTDIGQALSYAASLVEEPRRTIVIVISDFHEGAPEQRLYDVTKRLVEGGVKLLGLAALDEAAYPDYNHHIASRLVALGAEVAAMTPGELANWVAEKVR